ncbi:hypothetical protein SAMD00019534_063480 [Acytostelium subglobosum LB1]|uniref:hypothetical protein n=1 Tax=Acytostelium subglobosum LB1 TaxID=1410327 RepID=UPI0006448A8A|nr:hypothetical protein SAMD00019534_063480 [Acytostelium subglobosum LB1]GAM23173.1 hypothetical protein SAMD00019534_063480 [Acytostelium subglobosum LB1]|eukprot:XP_012753622.1 hypothetical protein SAMD00019534_063480 [Acytostelium subglobosum LB1]
MSFEQQHSEKNDSSSLPVLISTEYPSLDCPATSPLDLNSPCSDEGVPISNGDKLYLSDVLVPFSSTPNASSELKGSMSSRRRSPNVHKDHLICYKCKTTTTPEWRKGPDGPATLCNACGLSFAKKLKMEQGKSKHSSSISFSNNIIPFIHENFTNVPPSTFIPVSQDSQTQQQLPNIQDSSQSLTVHSIKDEVHTPTQTPTPPTNQTPTQIQTPTTTPTSSQAQTPTPTPTQTQTPSVPTPILRPTAVAPIKSESKSSSSSHNKKSSKSSKKPSKDKSHTFHQYTNAQNSHSYIPPHTQVVIKHSKSKMKSKSKSKKSKKSKHPVVPEILNMPSSTIGPEPVVCTPTLICTNPPPLPPSFSSSSDRAFNLESLETVATLPTDACPGRDSSPDDHNYIHYIDPITSQTCFFTYPLNGQQYTNDNNFSINYPPVEPTAFHVSQSYQTTPSNLHYSSSFQTTTSSQGSCYQQSIDYQQQPPQQQCYPIHQYPSFHISQASLPSPPDTSSDIIDMDNSYIHNNNINNNVQHGYVDYNMNNNNNSYYSHCVQQQQQQPIIQHGYCGGNDIGYSNQQYESGQHYYTYGSTSFGGLQMDTQSWTTPTPPSYMDGGHQPTNTPTMMYYPESDFSMDAFANNTSQSPFQVSPIMNGAPL